MPARAFYLQLLQANCNILFQDHAPIAVVTSANYRILVLSGTTGEILLSWDGTSHGDFEKFITQTEQRLAKHLEAGRYKGKPKDSDNEQKKKRNAELVARIERQEKELLDGKKKNDELMAMIADLEQKKRNAELVARIERKALLDGKKKENDELMAMIADLEQNKRDGELVARIERKALLDRQKKNDERMAMIADLEQKKRNAELLARIERQEKALLDGKRKNDELMAMIADLEQRKEDFETAFRGLNVELRALRREIAPAIEEFKKRKIQEDGMREYVDGVERNWRSLAARIEELEELEARMMGRIMGDHELATPETWSEVGDTSGW
jgi:chromosome segregation ATPase